MHSNVLGAAAGAAGRLATTSGAGVAGAQTDISTVGMSQEQAEATLSEAGVEYIILSRAGSTLRNCNVTEQRDRGYDTEVEYSWDADAEEWDKTETEVWRGVALVVFCD
jgi:hypothetical protein